ncbi:MAG: hypothetical protein JNL98_33295 [Bryobacterales bacterium]|nr:hypothetical protein [Bryobacterales bacterium]
MLPRGFFAILLSCAALDSADASRLNKRAGELLESAHGAIGGTQPEFQPGALLQLAIVESHRDRSKSVELFDQAIACAAALPQRENLRTRFLALTIAALARVDVERAIEKLNILPEAPAGQPDPRVDPIQQIVAILLEKSRKNPDRAIELVQQFGLSGVFPYRAAVSVIKVMPEDDPRRAMLLSLAQSAFVQRPDIDEFESFVRGLRPGRPVAMTQAQFDSGVRAMVRSAMEGKGIVFRRTQTITTSAGTVSLGDPRDVVLFNLVDLAMEVEPDLVTRMMEDRPALREAVRHFPKGKASLDKGEGVTTSGTVPADGEKSSPAEQARARRLVMETAYFQEVMTWYVKDPMRAIEAARKIPTAILKVRAIVTIAMNQKAEEVQAARKVLDACVKALEEVTPAGNRARGWASLASAALRYQDRELGLKLLERGLVDARELYKTDADPDQPNLAPRVFWPSAAAFRSLFYQAAKLHQDEAEVLLERCPDADIRVLGQIEIAAAWLGVTPVPATIQVFRGK